MKLSFDWLSDYIDLSGITPEGLAEKLTMNAFEVEGIECVGPDLQGPIVVGEILDIQPHPDPKASKMRVTKVRVEEGKEPLQIVCAAPNIVGQIGKRIPVALPGSVVVNRLDGSAFPITQADKRGVESNGMLCSPNEIGILDSEVDGILFLDPFLANRVGADVKELLYLKKDYVLTVASRSNRGDAVSVRGLAREISALLKRPMHEPQWQLEENTNEPNSFFIKIEDLKDCEYFSIRLISNIRVKNSPPWIARRLAAVGTRSINNLVDITNYVMHEWGQPMHAYDARAVKDGKFFVRRGKQGEKYITLDGKERTLTPEMLIISDTEKVIGMPIMGGANSEISESTTDIALEAASFLPATVRRSSRLLGLHSESGLRFERGVDAASTKQASDRATYLISKYCIGDTAVKIGPYVAEGKKEFPPAKVALRTCEIKRHLNLDLSVNEAKELLGRLEFQTVDFDDKSDKLIFAIPSYRQNDVQREIDLIEELARMYGYDNLKSETPPFLALSKMPDNINSAIRQSLSAQGLCEAYITSLVPEQTGSNGNKGSHSDFANYDASRAVKVLNPLSPEHQVLRQSLLPGLIDALKYNYDRGEENVWLFEIGFTYLKHTEKIDSPFPAQEDLKVDGLLSGNRKLSAWYADSNEKQNVQDRYTEPKKDFYHCKAIVENLLSNLLIPTDKLKYQSEPSLSLLHPGKSAKIIYKDDEETKVLGWLGQIHPLYQKELDLPNDTFLFELEIDVLKGLRVKSTFTEIPSLPPIKRDLTVDLPQNEGFAAMELCYLLLDQINKGENLLKKVDFNSKYLDINKCQTSYSYRFVFQSESRTLKSEEIEQKLNTIRELVKNKYPNAEFRASN